MQIKPQWHKTILPITLRDNSERQVPALVCEGLAIHRQIGYAGFLPGYSLTHVESGLALEIGKPRDLLKERAEYLLRLEGLWDLPLEQLVDAIAGERGSRVRAILQGMYGDRQYETISSGSDVALALRRRAEASHV